MGWDRLGLLVQHPVVVAITLVGTSLLLVSTLPVWSFKNFKVPSAYVLPLLLGDRNDGGTAAGGPLGGAGTLRTGLSWDAAFQLAEFSQVAG